MKRQHDRIKQKTKTACSLLTVVFLLSGCEGLLGLSTVSVITTDKTLMDHAVSMASNKDCSMVRSEKGLTYCKEDDPAQFIQDPHMHCYRELGRVTCYQDPDLSSPRPGIEDKKPAVPAVN